MKVILLIMMLIPVFLFEVYIFQDTMESYRTQKKRKQVSGSIHSGIRSSNIYYKVR